MDIKALMKRIEERAAELDKSIRAVSIEATNSPDTIRNWQRKVKTGEAFSMRQASLQAVADALGVELQWLLTGSFDMLGLENHSMPEETTEYKVKPNQSEAVRAIFAQTAIRAEVARQMTVNMPSLGLANGDLLVCDLGRDARVGDTVLVHVQDGKADGSTLARRWYSPWLLAYDTALDQDPLRDDEQGVKILYPVIGSIRGA